MTPNCNFMRPLARDESAVLIVRDESRFPIPKLE